MAKQNAVNVEPNAIKNNSMKIYIDTPKQQILVKPKGYVDNNVICQLPDTDIIFTINISKLKTSKGKPVTQMLLTKKVLGKK